MNRARDAAFVKRLAEPLFIAVRGRASAEVVEAVLRANRAATRAKDIADRTPLILAIEIGADITVIRALLAADAGAAMVKDRKDAPPLYVALQKKAPLPVIEALAAAAPKVIKAELAAARSSDATVLSAAATELSCSEEVLLALERAVPGFCDAEEGGTAELEAIIRRGGSLEDVQRSLAAHPLPTARGTAPAPPANLDASENWGELWKKGFKRRQCDLLFLALRHRASAAVVTEIFKAVPGAINVIDRNRLSALLVAVQCGADVETIRMLHKAEPDALRYSGADNLTPLYLAFKHKSPLPVVEELLAAEVAYSKKEKIDFSRVAGKAVDLGASDETIAAVERMLTPGYCSAEEGGTVELLGIVARGGSLEEVQASLSAHPLPKQRALVADAASHRSREAGLLRCHAELLSAAVRHGASAAVVSEIIRAAPKAVTTLDWRGRAALQVAVERGTEASVDVVAALLATGPDAAQYKCYPGIPNVSPLVAAVRARAPAAVIELVARAAPTTISNALRPDETLSDEMAQLLMRCRPEYCSPEEAGTATLEALLDRGCTAAEVQASVGAHPLPKTRAAAVSSSAASSERARKDALWETQSRVLFSAISKSAAPAVIGEIVRALPEAARVVVDRQGRSALYVALELGTGGADAILAMLAADPIFAKTADKDGWPPLYSAVKLLSPLAVIEAIAAAAPSTVTSRPRSGAGTVLQEAVKMGATADVIASLERSVPGYCSAEEGGTVELLGIVARGGSLEEVQASLSAHPLPKERVNPGAPPPAAKPVLQNRYLDSDSDDDDSNLARGNGLFRCHAELLIAAVRQQASAAVVSEIVRASPKAMAMQDYQGRSALMVAIERGHEADTDVIKALTTEGPDGTASLRALISKESPIIVALRARVPLPGILALLHADPEMSMRQIKNYISALENAPGDVVSAIEHFGECSTAEAGTTELEALLRRGCTAPEVEACVSEHPLPSTRTPTADEIRDAAEEAAAARARSFKERQAEPLLIAVRQRADVAVVSAVLAALPAAALTVDHRGRTPLHVAAEAGAGADVLRALATAAPDSVMLKDRSGVIPLMIALKKRAPLSSITALLETKPGDSMAAFGGRPNLVVAFAKRAGAGDDILAALERAAVAAVAGASGSSGDSTSRADLCDAQEAGTAELEALLRRSGSLDEVQACLDAPAARAMAAGTWATATDSAEGRRIARRVAEPLFIALRQAAPAGVVSALVAAAPVSLKALDHGGRTALHVAVEVRSSADVVEALVAANPDAARKSNAAGATPLLVAVRCKSPLPVIEALARVTPPLGDDESNPLYAAVEMKAPVDVIAAIARAWPGSCGKAPLQVALESGAAAVVAVLARAADPLTLTFQGNSRKSALSHAIARKCDAACVEALLAAVPALALDRSATGTTPLHEAVIVRSKIEVIRALVATGPGALAVEFKGKTPLEHALDSSTVRPDVVAALFAATEPAARTLSLVVCAGTPADVAAFIAEHPASPLERDVKRRGRTALHVAADFGASLEVVQALLAAAPEAVRMLDDEGCTPLHLSLSLNTERKEGEDRAPVILALLKAAPDCLLWARGERRKPCPGREGGLGGGGREE